PCSLFILLFFSPRPPPLSTLFPYTTLFRSLWVTLKHLLQRRPALIPKPAAADVGNTQPLTPMQALALLSKLHSGDIVLPTTDGREIRLRRVTEPTAEQKSLLDLLGSSLPDRLSFNRQCSVDSAIA